MPQFWAGKISIRKVDSVLESYKYMYNYDVKPCEQKCDSTQSLINIYTIMVFCSHGRLLKTLFARIREAFCFGIDSIDVFTICRIAAIMSTTLLVPHSKNKLYIQQVPIFRMGSLASSLFALIVCCNVIVLTVLLVICDL